MSHRTIEEGDVLVIYLREPKERLFGQLVQMMPYGITVRGMDIGSFDDWQAQCARGGAQPIQPSTIFLPMARLERLILDEGTEGLPSFQDRFFKKVGATLDQFLTPPGDDDRDSVTEN